MKNAIRPKKTKKNRGDFKSECERWILYFKKNLDELVNHNSRQVFIKFVIRFEKKVFSIHPIVQSPV